MNLAIRVERCSGSALNFVQVFFCKPCGRFDLFDSFLLDVDCYWYMKKGLNCLQPMGSMCGPIPPLIRLICSLVSCCLFGL